MVEIDVTKLKNGYLLHIKSPELEEFFIKESGGNKVMTDCGTDMYSYSNFAVNDTWYIDRYTYVSSMGGPYSFNITCLALPGVGEGITVFFNKNNFYLKGFVKAINKFLHKEVVKKKYYFKSMVKITKRLIDK